jgi:hypothetical protein
MGSGAMWVMRYQLKKKSDFSKKKSDFDQKSNFSEKIGFLKKEIRF